MDGQQASEVLKDNDLAASDLVAGKYEGHNKLILALADHSM